MTRLANIALLLCLVWTPAAVLHAEIVSSSPGHYVLHHEAASGLTAEALWLRLTNPAAWWHPDHTYSGSAGNLTLEVEAGGLWREDWDGGSVTHGRVVLVIDGRLLRLEAPFGPLQGAGAYTIWTIAIESTAAGSRVTFDESAIAPPDARLDELAAAVDGVKTEAIRRLAGPD